MRFGNFLSALLGALTVAAVVVVAGIGDDSAREPSAPAPATPVANTETTDAAAVYERARPGVVDVQTGRGNGSGFVLDREGRIVTNQHVVDGARDVEVRFDGQRDAVDGRVVGTDASTDLALVKIDPADVEDGLKPLPLGSSSDLRVGEPTIALGSPFGLDGTLTTGVVSALDRDIESPNGFAIDGVVQTDAAINPGNSGGPLLDAGGRVIGVNAQIASGSGANDGVGFAIPVDTAREVVAQLERGGTIERAYLGVSVGEPRGGGDGALVGRVVAGGPAAGGGLRAGDVIVRIGDTAVTQADQVADAIEDRKPGHTVPVVVERGGERETVQVELGTRPAQAPQS